MSHFLRNLFFGILILWPLNIQAATFDFDYSANSTLFIADDGTQTEWLHLSENDHLTFAQVNAALGTDPNLEGYQIATLEMVGQVTEQLFGFNWATLPVGVTTAYDEYCLSAVSFFDITYSSSTYPDYVWGHVADIANDNPNTRYTMMLTNNNFSGYRDNGFLYRNVVSITDINPQRGTFLVREVSSVPIPGAAWLLGLGIAGLAVLRRKK